MTGPQPGDAEDLLGQFLAHRGTPPRARGTAVTPSPDTSAEPDAQPSPESAADEAVEESVDGPVYELADEPLDFSDTAGTEETEEPETPAAGTMAQAGAVLQAFASGTLEVEHDGAHEVEDVPALTDPEDTEAAETGRKVGPEPATDAARAVLAAFLGEPEPPAAEPEPPAGAHPFVEPTAQPTPEPAPRPTRKPTIDDAAFEELAVSSPLTRDPGSPDPRPTGGGQLGDDRPDSTAASAAVFAAFQEQLAKEASPAQPPASAPLLRPKGRLRPKAATATEPEATPETTPVTEPQPPEPEPEPVPEIAPPVARAQAPRPARQRAPRPEPKVTAPRLPAAESTPAPAPARAAVPNEVVFKPRRVARALVALVLIVFIAASALACWWAYRDRTLVPVGIAATVLIATGIVWATRAGSSVAHLSVKGGRLEITKDGTRTVFDLASRYTDIDVHGTAGKRGWKVLFGRRGLPPYVVDASMVSPTEFMRVLDYYRPPESRAADR